MKVEEIMTPAPLTVDLRGTVAEVVDKFLEFDISAVIVVNGSEYLGIITDKELRPFSFPSSGEADTLKGYRKHLNAKVSDVVRSDVPVLSPDMELTRALDLMVESGATVLPVVEDSSMVLCGAVTQMDLVQAARSVFDD